MSWTRCARVARRSHGRVPLIGFAGSPWTLATYMVEGGTSREFRRVKGLLFEAPRLLHELLDKLARAVTAYLKAQAEAGAQVLMVFDTWGGVLSTHAYDEFSLRYLAEVVAGVKAAPAPPPVILFTKGGGGWIEPIAATGCEAVGLDWTQDLGAMRRRVGDQVALQGNLDPLALYAPPERIRAEVSTLLSSFGAGSGHVFNLGHGIEPDTDPEHVRVLVDAVHELSVPYHSGVEPSGVEPSESNDSVGAPPGLSRSRAGAGHGPGREGAQLPPAAPQVQGRAEPAGRGAGAAHPRDGSDGVARLPGLLRPHGT